MNIINEKENLKEKVAGWIARTEPPTFAHLEYILKLSRLYKKVVIISGSKYTLGNSRHCFPSSIRVKMIKAMLDEVNFSRDKYEIVTLSDYEDNEKWLDELGNIANMYNIDDIVSGNEWVQDIVINQDKYKLRAGDIPLDKEIPYHATDVRKTIEIGNYKKLKQYVPKSVIKIMCDYGCFRNIQLANNAEEVIFVPGRQTVDMVFLLRDKKTNKLYCLLGKRPEDAIDFANVMALPGGPIEKFELPEDACIRVFEEETGIFVEELEDTFVSTPVKIRGIKATFFFMNMVGIYSSEETDKIGTRGGSSECYSIYVEGDVDEYRHLIKKSRGLIDVDFYEVSNIINETLAFQHDEMLERAVDIAKGSIKFEKDVRKKTIDSKCIFFVGGPGSGKSTAANGLMFLLKILGLSSELVSEFAKDKVYEGNLPSVLKCQSLIIGEQDYRVSRLLGKVDYIVSDAPLNITAMHASNEKPLEQAAYYLFEKTNNYIIFIEKDKNASFETKGRLEDEKSAQKKAQILKDNLDSRGYSYVTANGSIEATKLAIKYVISNEPSLRKKEDEIISNLEVIMKGLGGLSNGI